MMARMAATTRAADTEAKMIVTLEGEPPMLLPGAPNGDAEGIGEYEGVVGIGERDANGDCLSGIVNGLGDGASVVLPSSDTLRAAVELVHCRFMGKTSKFADVRAKRAGTVLVEHPFPRIIMPTSTGLLSSSYWNSGPPLSAVLMTGHIITSKTRRNGCQEFK